MTERRFLKDEGQVLYADISPRFFLPPLIAASRRPSSYDEGLDPGAY